MKNFLLLLFLSIYVTLAAQPWTDHGKILVKKDNPHYLQFEDGAPFFWFGDTGWELFHRLNRDEADFYLENRKEKGFNVIQAVLISEFIHIEKQTNFYGDSIFVNEDPEMPKITTGNNSNVAEEYDYWDHADYIISKAKEKGLYIGLVASWGEWVIPRDRRPLFNTKEQAYNYGWFLGQRYGKFPNIIWILGGDREPNERQNGPDYWRAMAEGIADGTNNVKNFDGKADYSTTLMTHHSFRSSSNWFHNDDWIDFHTWGSYHDRINNYRAFADALKDFYLKNPKPTINSEPNYEQHGINYAVEDNGVFTSTDVRLAAYWSVFSGAAGHTYGAQPIWQFTDETRPKFSNMTFHSWKAGLEFPGAVQVRYLKSLMLSREFKNLVPDTNILVKVKVPYALHQAAIRGKSFLMAYTPEGESLEIQLGKISGKQVKAWWFDPRKGTSQLIGVFENSGIKKFDVPGMSNELTWLKTGRGCDWVLVIDDVDAGFPEPGKIK